MKIGIYANTKKTPAKETTLRIIHALEKFGVQFALHEKMKGYYDCEYFDFDNLNVDMIFSLGGDGTILKIAKYCPFSSIYCSCGLPSTVGSSIKI